MNKLVLITGTSQGIGLAIAQEFLNNNYQVIVLKKQILNCMIKML